MITIKDVSKAANVSIATVSLVANGKGVISEKTRKHVLSVMKELGYQPNSHARSLASKRSNSVGVIVYEMSSSHHSTLFSNINEIVKRKGMNLIITSYDWREDKEKAALQHLIDHRCEVVILYSETPLDPQVLSILETTKKIIVINDLFPEEKGCNILFDNEGGGYMAGKHLIRNGHRKIACIMGPLSLIAYQQRLKGFRRAMEEFGIDCNENLILETPMKEEGGANAIRDLLDRGESFTAVFAGDDEMAAGAMYQLKKSGMSIPDDVSVMGFNDQYFSKFCFPPLTTIEHPIAEIGKTAGKIAASLMKGEDLNGRYPFSPKLVSRETVKDISQG